MMDMEEYVPATSSKKQTAWLILCAFFIKDADETREKRLKDALGLSPTIARIGRTNKV